MKIPLISNDDRNKLYSIFDSQLNSYSSTIDLVTWNTDHLYMNQYDYHNIFDPKHLNIIKDADSRPIMSVFSFSAQNAIRIYRILNFDNPVMRHPRLYNGLRLYAQSKIPLHVDQNNGKVGRDKLVFNITVNGNDSAVYFSNDTSGKKLVHLYGKCDWAMYPNLVIHGAEAGKEHLDLIQIQME